MPAKKPNIIWIMSDQHRGQALSCNGDPNARTPNLDTLSFTGVNFVNAVGGYPLCCPFRGSMLTSVYPHQCVPGHQYQLPPGQSTIAHVMNDAGYHTAYFGKWHLDGFQESEGRAAKHVVPPERRGGFAEWIGYENNNSQYDCWVHGGEGETAFMRRLPGYETDCLTDILLEYLGRRDAGQPFFAVLSVQPPHNPYVAPPEYMAKYNPGSLVMRGNVPDIPEVQAKARRELAGAYAMIENLDWNIGRVRQKLMDLNLAFDTHIMYFSDHGDMHGSHGQTHKTTAFEESIRVPFIIGGSPSHYEYRSNIRVNYPINHVDIAPTTLGLCGIGVPEWMQGTDYSSLRLPGKPPSEACFPDSAYLQSVIPTGHAHSCDKKWRGIVTTDNWKYVCFEGVDWLMFNLNNDPLEQANLAHNTFYAAKRRELRARLRKWVEDTGDDFLLPE